MAQTLCTPLSRPWIRVCRSHELRAGLARRVGALEVKALGAAPPTSAAPHRRSTTCRSAAEGSRGGAVGTATGEPKAVGAPTRLAGSLAGAIALITGSTVGAGMLALPAVTAPAGLVPTAASLCGCWVLLTLEALLIAEVNIAVHEERGEADASSIITLRQMAESTLGSPGKLVTLVYLLLSYSLLVAYLSKASEVLDYFWRSMLAGLHLPMLSLPPAATASAFVGAMGALFLLGGPKAADKMNQGLTSVLMALFFGILGAGALQSDAGATLTQGGADWAALGPALPIVFLSLVYHDLVPVLVQFLAGDRKTVRTAIVLGGAVPLLMFLSWEMVALSLVPGSLVSDAASSAGAVMQASLQLVTAAGPGDALATMPHASAEVLSAAASAAGTASQAAADVAPVLTIDGPAALTVDPLEVFVRRSGHLVGSAVEAFSFLAVMTSFTGTTLSLSETLASEVPPLLREVGRVAGLVQATVSGSLLGSTDEVEADMPLARLPQGAAAAAAASAGGAEAGMGTLRGVALALTLGPPLVATIYNPNSFLGMLTTAGAYGMTLLYGCMPPLMAWQQRAQRQRQAQQQAQRAPGRGRARAATRQHQQQGSPADLWMVPGGQPVLAGMLAVAVALEVSRLATDMGLSLGGGQPTLEGMVQTAATTAAELLPAAMVGWLLPG